MTNTERASDSPTILVMQSAEPHLGCPDWYGGRSAFRKLGLGGAR